MKFSICQESRKGGREVNQDCIGYCFTRGSLVMALADGMGGRLLGEIAAELAIKTVIDDFRQFAHPMLPDPGRFLNDAFHHAHQAIFEYAERNRLGENPGTTCVACVVQDETTRWAHAGDSRFYLYRDNRLVVRTRDHSRAQELIERGMITEKEAAEHYARNDLTNCLGNGRYEGPGAAVSDIYRLDEGDALLLCSDGVWSPLAEDEIAALLRGAPLARAIPELLNRAQARTGAHADNLSAIGFVWGGDDVSQDGASDKVVTVTPWIGAVKP